MRILILVNDIFCIGGPILRILVCGNWNNSPSSHDPFPSLVRSAELITWRPDMYFRNNILVYLNFVSLLLRVKRGYTSN